jgi:uncharacterized membrane protein (UPF0136 family)
MFAEKKWGAYTALGLTIALTAVFCFRYAASGKNFPAILSVVSAGMLLYLLSRVAHWKKPLD